jgi:hypothetical protein
MAKADTECSDHEDLVELSGIREDSQKSKNV